MVVSVTTTTTTMTTVAATTTVKWKVEGKGGKRGGGEDKTVMAWCCASRGKRLYLNKDRFFYVYDSFLYLFFMAHIF